jgi:hypothetical protein
MDQNKLFSKAFSGNQTHCMYKRNRRFEGHLGLHHQGCVSYHIPDDEDRDGPQNINLFYTSDMADCV